MPDTLEKRFEYHSHRDTAADGLVLGHRLLHGQLRSDQPIVLPHHRRPEHLAILGKTGMGKSSLLRFLCEQDIRDDRGFVFFDLHGDATPALAQLISQEEQRRGEDLSRKFVVFDPADRDFSIGINILEADDDHQRYVQIAEVTRILRDRWHLDAFGGRTEELLRNTLIVLQDNRLTVVEIGPLLVDPAFRARCLSQTTNSEARIYFETRYNRLSPAAQAEYREPVLNKVSVFSADPHFRHILGQHESTFQLSEAVDARTWIIFNLDKGRLGEQAATLGSLLMTRLRHVLFARRSRELVTLYCDELQNLVALDRGIDHLFAEARKLGISVCAANQYLDQYPFEMRAAVLSVGTLLFFQLSALDADRISSIYGNDAVVGFHLRTLPPRQFLARVLTRLFERTGVPDLPTLDEVDPNDLLARSRMLWSERRSHIEEAIAARHGRATAAEALDGWN
jgi:hypothetical protein